jgi:hypothetical protein
VQPGRAAVHRRRDDVVLILSVVLVDLAKQVFQLVPRRPAEEDVSDVEVPSAYARHAEGNVKLLSGGAHEGAALALLLLAGRLADDGHGVAGEEV